MEKSRPQDHRLREFVQKTREEYLQGRFTPTKKELIPLAIAGGSLIILGLYIVKKKVRVDDPKNLGMNHDELESPNDKNLPSD